MKWLAFLLLAVPAWAVPPPVWVSTPDGTLAQYTAFVPRGYGYPVGSHVTLSITYDQIVGVLVTKRGIALCELHGIFTGTCSIIEGCGPLGPALDTCN